MTFCVEFFDASPDELWFRLTGIADPGGGGFHKGDILGNKLCPKGSYTICSDFFRIYAAYFCNFAGSPPQANKTRHHVIWHVHNHSVTCFFPTTVWQW